MPTVGLNALLADGIRMGKPQALAAGNSRSDINPAVASRIRSYTGVRLLPSGLTMVSPSRSVQQSCQRSSQRFGLGLPHLSLEMPGDFLEEQEVLERVL